MIKKSDIKIAIDAMGGDNAPNAIIAGANIAAAKDDSIFFSFYGDENIISPIINKHQNLRNRYDIIHSEEHIKPETKPSFALRRYLKSSMRLAINSVKEKKSDAILSAGNTGALMAISKLLLRTMSGIERPAIVTMLPNIKNKSCIMLDLGANSDCDSYILYQFAVMGYSFFKAMNLTKDPKIGILNIGSEELKGNDRVKNTANLIKESKLSKYFIGYVEGDDITNGDVDIVITDGFTGNITLKSIEGIGKLISKNLKTAFSTNIISKLGYLISSYYLKKTMQNMDPRYYNGAMLVGLNGIVVKSHGNADALSFANAISITSSLVKQDINSIILNEINNNLNE